MPKTTNEAAKAVTKATRLMPVDSWAEPPAPSGIEVVVAAAGEPVAVAGNGVVELLICVDDRYPFFRICRLIPTDASAMVYSVIGHVRWPPLSVGFEISRC